MFLPLKEDMSATIRPTVCEIGNGMKYILPYWILFESNQQFEIIKQMFNIAEEELQLKIDLQPKPIHDLPMEVKTFKIIGSKGDSYTVTFYPSGVATCTCKGFMFRRTCRHIDEAQTTVEV